MALAISDSISSEGNWRGLFVNFSYDAIESLLPFIMREYLYLNLLMFFYMNFLKRLKNTVLKKLHLLS